MLFTLVAMASAADVPATSSAFPRSQYEISIQAGSLLSEDPVHADVGLAGRIAFGPADRNVNFEVNPQFGAYFGSQAISSLPGFNVDREDIPRVRRWGTTQQLNVGVVAYAGPFSFRVGPGVKVTQDHISERTQRELHELAKSIDSSTDLVVEPVDQLTVLGGAYVSFEAAPARVLVVGVNASAFAGNQLNEAIEEHPFLNTIDYSLDGNLTLRVLPRPWLAIDAAVGAGLRPDSDTLMAMPKASAALTFRPGAR